MFHLRTLESLLPRWLRWIIALDVFGGSLVLAFWSIMGDGPNGIGPYLDAVSRAGQSPEQLGVYMLAIAVYSIGVEFSLRVIVQEFFEKRPRIASLGVPCAALAYGVMHSMHNPAGVVYAAALGLGTAFAYHTMRDVKVLMAWHIQWNMLAIAGTLAMAMLFNGDARAHFLYEYKSHQVASGKITYSQGWGWVDADHYENHDLDRAMRWVRDPEQKTLTLTAKIHGVFGDEHRVVRTYTLHQANLSRRARWGAACSAVLDFSVHYEQRQADLPWILGTRMSAFQPEDATSTLFMCLNSSPPDGPSLPTMARQPLTREQNIARWRAEGLDVSRRTEPGDRPPAGAHVSDHDRRMLIEIEQGRAFWSAQ